MSWIKRAYIGGDKYKCTRYDGIVHPAGKNFECSKIVLVDNDGSHLPPVKTLADQMAHNCGIDL